MGAVRRVHIGVIQNHVPVHPACFGWKNGLKILDEIIAPGQHDGTQADDRIRKPKIALAALRMVKTDNLNGNLCPVQGGSNLHDFADFEPQFLSDDVIHPNVHRSIGLVLF